MTETTSAIAAICTLLTVIAGFVYQYLRETRQHKWEQYERNEAKAESRAARHSLGQQIAANTTLTQATKDAALEAQREANHANEKLAAIGVQAREMGIELIKVNLKETPK